jgi:hypothetical protein
MTVHPIHGVGSAAQPGAAAAVPGVAAGAHRPTDSVEVSAAAALLRRLDALLHESPARFRAVTASVAGRLGEQAAAAEPRRALVLSRLAERFGAASREGSPSPLVAEHAAPARPPPAAAPGASPGAAGPPSAVPASAALAAAALAAGSAASKPARAVSRSAYRARVERAGGQAADADEPGGGLLGTLLSSAAGLVEAALAAALEESPPEDARSPGHRP